MNAILLDTLSRTEGENLSQVDLSTLDERPVWISAVLSYLPVPSGRFLFSSGAASGDLTDPLRAENSFVRKPHAGQVKHLTGRVGVSTVISVLLVLMFGQSTGVLSVFGAGESLVP